MNPRIEKTHLQDAVLISGDSYADDRGLFMESYNVEDLAGELFESFNLPKKDIVKKMITYFPQDNVAQSKPGVLRGLHIQRSNPQGKLVRCLQGRILDVIVDLRKNSDTFMKHGAFELNSESKKMLWVPSGFAHGYYSYDDSIVYYKCSTLYDNKSDGGINPFDVDLDIKWPSRKPIMTEKDLSLPTMKAWLQGK